MSGGKSIGKGGGAGWYFFGDVVFWSVGWDAVAWYFDIGMNNEIEKIGIREIAAI